MKVSNGAVWSMFENQTGEPLVLKLSNAKLSASASYKRLKNLKALETLRKDIAELHDDIVKKYGKEKDGSISISVKDVDAWNSYLNDFNEILSKEEEVEIKKFTLNELDGKLELSNQEFVLLSFIIEDNEEEEA